MCAVLGWDPSKATTVETGKSRATELDIVQYLSVCGFTREQIDEFYERYRLAFEPFGFRLPENLRTLALAESTAIKITSFDLATVPGLLQTEDYARALIEQGNLERADQIEHQVRARMDRQVILRRACRPDCTFYVHEDVLLRCVGSDQIMAAQVTRLMFHTHVLRIVPECVYQAAYKLLEYEKDKPVVYLDSDLVQVFAQDPRAIARCKLVFERLDEVALDESESRALLMQYVRWYDQQRDPLAEEQP